MVLALSSSKAWIPVRRASTSPACCGCGAAAGWLAAAELALPSLLAIAVVIRFLRTLSLPFRRELELLLWLRLLTMSLTTEAHRQSAGRNGSSGRDKGKEEESDLQFSSTRTLREEKKNHLLRRRTAPPPPPRLTSLAAHPQTPQATGVTLMITSVKRIAGKKTTERREKRRVEEGKSGSESGAACPEAARATKRGLSAATTAIPSQKGKSKDGEAATNPKER